MFLIKYVTNNNIVSENISMKVYYFSTEIVPSNDGFASK